MPPSPCDQFTASSSKKFTKYKLKVTQAFKLPKITESKNKYPYSTIFQLVISFKYEPFKIKGPNPQPHFVEITTVRTQQLCQQ